MLTSAMSTVPSPLISATGVAGVLPNIMLMTALTSLMPDEALLLVMRDGKNNYVYRAEHVTSLVQDNINTTGETLFDVEFNGILHCEVVASDCIQHYADGIDLPRKQVGYNLKRGAGTFEDSIAQLLDQAVS